MELMLIAIIVLACIATAMTVLNCMFILGMLSTQKELDEVRMSYATLYVKYVKAAYKDQLDTIADAAKQGVN